MKLSQLIATVFLLGLALSPAAEAQSDQDAYREARRALNRERFDEAITTFQTLRREHPESRYVADSYYWEAFALERSGELERAVASIDSLLARYPNAETIGEARALRAQVCGELARRGGAECADALAVTDGGDEATRLAAVNALINMPAARAAPIAMRVLSNRSQSVRVRKQALFVLADKADGANLEAEARQTLLDTALDETDSLELRKQAVFWLSELDGEETLQALAELMTRTTDQELQKQAIFAISQHRSSRAAGLLQDFARDERLSVALRKQAVFWLGQLAKRDPQSGAFLIDLYGTLTDIELKKHMLFVVSETDTARARSWLFERANDGAESVEVRKQALFWLGESGAPVAELRSLYRTTDERALREQLIFVLSQHDGEGSLDALIDIARADPDPGMRRKAVHWIGESDDPRAEAFLLELLEQ